MQLQKSLPSPGGLFHKARQVAELQLKQVPGRVNLITKVGKHSLKEFLKDCMLLVYKRAYSKISTGKHCGRAG